MRPGGARQDASESAISSQAEPVGDQDAGSHGNVLHVELAQQAGSETGRLYTVFELHALAGASAGKPADLEDRGAQWCITGRDRDRNQPRAGRQSRSERAAELIANVDDRGGSPVVQEQPRLGLAVARQVTVVVEMIARQVGEGGHPESNAGDTRLVQRVG